MKRILFILGLMAATPAYAAPKCPTGQYLNDDICVDTDIGYYVDCHDIPASEYTQLTYIESNGKQEIDTGYSATKDTVILIQYEYTDTPSDGIVSDTLINDDYNKTGIQFYRSQRWVVTHCRKNGGGWIAIKNKVANIEYIETLDHSKYISNGLQYTLKQNYDGLHNYNSIKLFKGNAGVANQYSSARMKYATFTENGVMMRNFIPVRRHSDNAVGMFDTVEQKFYSGSFTGGADVEICSTQIQCPLGSYCVNGIRHICQNGTNHARYTETGWTTPTCPWVCDDGYIKTAANTCNTLCTAGATSLQTSTGVNVPLFASRNTTPSINIGIGDNVCYVDLVSGTADGAINVQYDSKTYHTAP